MKTKIFNFIFLNLTPAWFVKFESTFKLYCWLAAMGYEDKPSLSTLATEKQQMETCILDCWDWLKNTNTRGKGHLSYQDIAENQFDLIKALVDILEPIVNKIMGKQDGNN